YAVARPSSEWIPAVALRVEKSPAEVPGVADRAAKAPGERGAHHPEAREREPTGEPSGHGHHLAHDEKRESRGHTYSRRGGNLNPSALAHSLRGRNRENV